MAIDSDESVPTLMDADSVSGCSHTRTEHSASILGVAPDGATPVRI
jgi:hypothetical protein